MINVGIKKKCEKIGSLFCKVVKSFYICISKQREDTLFLPVQHKLYAMREGRFSKVSRS